MPRLHVWSRMPDLKPEEKHPESIGSMPEDRNAALEMFGARATPSPSPCVSEFVYERSLRLCSWIAFRIAMVVLIVTLALSYSGSWLPLGDSLAVFRLHIAALQIIGGLILFLGRHFRLALTVLGLAFFAVLPISLQFIPPAVETVGNYTLYQKNMLYNGKQQDSLQADILAVSPDFVTLQEVSTDNLKALNLLFEAYPFHAMCKKTERFGVAVLSRFPIIPGSMLCYGQDGLAVVKIDLGDRSVWLGSLHLIWPFPFSQAAQARRLADRLAKLDGEVILAGDFNMVPWGASLNAIAHGAHAANLGPAVSSFGTFSPILPLAIDHVLVPLGHGGSIKTRPKFGSDHLGILAQLDLR